MTQISKNLAYSNKYILYVFVVSFFCFFLTTSCRKYLDEKSNNAITVPTTLTDLQGLLDDASSVMNVGLTPAFGEASSDDYFLLKSDYDSRLTREQRAYIWLPSDYSFPNDWSRSYGPVYNSNYCLEMVEKIPITAQNEISWKNVKGSALFYRAYNFLNLAWNHAKAYDENSFNSDLGIALRLESDFNIPSVRGNVKETYERIISDAKDAISFLPNIALHQYRPSKAAAYGLLARAYLSMRKYDSAYKYSNLCLSLKSDLVNYADFPISTTSTNPTFVPFNQETIFYTDMFSTFISNLAVTRAKVDTVLYLTYANNDRRKYLFFVATGLYQRFKGSYSGSGFFTGIATDEMFLIRSECNARLGNITSAMTDLNTLLAKRWNSGTFIPLMASDANDALNKILMERRKELIFRGLRWMDIKRLNREGRNIILNRLVDGQIYSLQPNANYFALPLPTDIINLTNMPQNIYP